MHRPNGLSYIDRTVCAQELTTNLWTERGLRTGDFDLGNDPGVMCFRLKDNRFIFSHSRAFTFSKIKGATVVGSL